MKRNMLALHFAGRNNPALDSPDVIPIQPVPRETLVADMQTTAGPLTAIARLWRTGDIGRCRLCPTCNRDPDDTQCLVVVNRHIDPDEAPLLDLRHCV